MTNINVEPMNVMIEFQNGSKSQYQILVPDHDEIDLQVWFNTHKFISAREVSNNFSGELCVDQRPTFINLHQVSSVKELDW